MVIGKLAYYFSWMFRTAVLRRRIPLNSSLILTDQCNLNCKHCTVAHLGYEPRQLEEVRLDLEALYKTGSRVLIITGGEPFVWKDQGGNTVEDVVKLSREMGFFRIVICTNGTLPLESSADYLWVSLDGYEKEHDAIRGSVFQGVVDNIQASSHRGLYVNFTISTNNRATFTESAEEILQIPNVNGILFHLFTPYLDSDESLLLRGEERQAALHDLAAFKRKHPLATFNTFAGIRALTRDSWQRPTWASVTANQGQLSPCCCRRGIYDAGVCTRCGCTPAVETWVLQTCKLTAMLENLRYI